MKLIRKAKKKVIVIDTTKDPFNPDVYERIEYEDVLQESLFKKILKKPASWLIVAFMIILGLSVITTQDKWVAVFNTTVFWLYVVVFIYHIKELKQEIENN